MRIATVNLTWGHAAAWAAILYDDQGVAVAQIGDAKTEQAAIDAMTKLAKRINPAKEPEITRGTQPRTSHAKEPTT